MKTSSGLRVVIVNGKPGCGKTTFENCCETILGHAYCRRRSTVDKVKELACEAGWDGQKTPEARKLLSDLKDLFTKYNDMPKNDIVTYLKGWEEDLKYFYVGNYPHVLFVDDREPEHIDRLKKELNAITLLIRRPGDELVETSNHADENVFEYEYDYIIDNNSDIENLIFHAEVFLNSIFSKNRDIIDI